MKIGLADGLSTTILGYSARGTNALAHVVHEFNVYPNSKTGSYTVDFAEKRGAEDCCSLYGALGIFLLQCPEPPVAAVEIVGVPSFGTGSSSKG